MSDNAFPGFEDDEPAKPVSKPAVKPPVSAAPTPRAKPATGKIVSASDAPPPLSGASGPVSFEFEDSEPAKPKKAYVPPPAEPLLAAAPGKGKAAGAIDRSPPAPSTQAAEEADADLKPGSRKDLWNCPHCGTGNRPGRETCRSCGKSPDEPVIVPVHKKPAVVLGTLGGAIVLVVLVVLVLSHTDMTLKPADAAVIDSKPRVSGAAASHSVTISGSPLAFTGTKRLSVDGRLIGATQSLGISGGWNVVLLFGSAGSDPDAASKTKVTFNGDMADVDGPGRYVLLHLLPAGPVNAFKPKTGAMLSLDGDSGELDGFSNGMGEYTVWVDHLDQQ